MTTFAQVAETYNRLSHQIKDKYPQLKDWTFTWNSRITNAMGRCVLKQGKKYIELSTKIVSLNLSIPNFIDKIQETIIHEWAHALEYEEKKVLSHSPCWRKWMATMGKIPERCYDGSLWLMQPRGKGFAIRNKVTGRIFSYFTFRPTNEQILRAHRWHRVQLMRPAHEDLELVNLENATSLTLQ